LAAGLAVLCYCGTRERELEGIVTVCRERSDGERVTVCRSTNPHLKDTFMACCKDMTVKGSKVKVD